MDSTSGDFLGVMTLVMFHTLLKPDALWSTQRSTTTITTSLRQLALKRLGLRLVFV